MPRVRQCNTWRNFSSADAEVVEKHGLRKIASGKVREIYKVDEKTLLFVATDRISAYDVIMTNVRAPLSYPYRQTGPFD